MLPTNPADVLPAREGPNRLLRNRPDLAMHRAHRRRAREIAESLGLQVGPIDVLAAWLGAQPSLDTKDLESALADRLQLRLARTAPKQRRDADTPALRADIGLALGWEQLRGRGPRDAARLSALLDGAPCPSAFLEQGAAVGAGAIEDCVRAGFLVEEDGALGMHAALVAYVRGLSEGAGEARERLLRCASALRQALVPGVDPRLVAAAPAVVAAAEREDWGDVVAALSLRLAQQARRAALEATPWIDRGLAAARGSGFRALLHAERAAHHLESDELDLARVALGEARLAFEASPLDAPAGLSEQLQLLDLALSAAEGAPPGPLLARAATAAHQRGPHPGSALAAHHVAGTLALRVGDAGLARRYLERATTLVEEQLDADDPRRVAVLLTQARRFASDLQVHDLLERARVLAGGDLDRTSSRALPWVLYELGVRAADEGDFDSAGTLLDESAMLAASLLAPQHRLRAIIGRTRALLLLASGEPTRAGTAALRAWEFVERSLPEADSDRALTRLVHTLCRQAEGQASAADVRVAADAAVDRLRTRGEANPAVSALRAWREDTLMTG